MASSPAAASVPGGPSPRGPSSSSPAAGLPQQYCLRWNNHQHNLLSVFEELLNSEAFVDVTLACDGLQLKAHKMVLSACSPYFQAMLYNTPDRHPIVFLRDVRYHEMKALLEFMYRGEVSVDQENLSSLLKVAEGLKIKGLAEVNDDSSPSPSSNTPTPRIHPAGFPSSSSVASALLAAHHPDALTSPMKRMSSPPVTGNGHYVGPKRKRAKPRRLSGSEAVPLASGLTEDGGSSSNRSTGGPLEVQTEEINLNTKMEKVLKTFFIFMCTPIDLRLEVFMVTCPRLFLAFDRYNLESLQCICAMPHTRHYYLINSRTYIYQRKKRGLGMVFSLTSNFHTWPFSKHFFSSQNIIDFSAFLYVCVSSSSNGESITLVCFCSN